MSTHAHTHTQESISCHPWLHSRRRRAPLSHFWLLCTPGWACLSHTCLKSPPPIASSSSRTSQRDKEREGGRQRETAFTQIIRIFNAILTRGGGTSSHWKTKKGTTKQNAASSCFWFLGLMAATLLCYLLLLLLCHSYLFNFPFLTLKGTALPPTGCTVDVYSFETGRRDVSLMNQWLKIQHLFRSDGKY